MPKSNKIVFLPAENADAIGRLIAARRKCLGLSQEGLGHKMGVSPFQIWAWEKGKDTPDLMRAQMLHNILGGHFREYTDSADYQPRATGRKVKATPPVPPPLPPKRKRTPRSDRPWPDTSTVAGRIEGARLNKGISQLALDRMLNVAAGTVNRWENGRQLPSDRAAYRIAEIFGGHWSDYTE